MTQSHTNVSTDDESVKELIRQKRLAILDRVGSAAESDPTDAKLANLELQALRDLEHPILVGERNKVDKSIGELHTQAILAEMQMQRENTGNPYLRAAPPNQQTSPNSDGIRTVQGLDPNVPLIDGVSVIDGEFRVGNTNIDYEQFANMYDLDK